MRTLSFRMLLALSILFVSFTAFATDVTISGTNNFAALDGGADDADHVANGVFTVNGNLTVNGTVNCNDEGAGVNSACAMTFNVSGNFVMNAGSALYAENRTKDGNGGDITVTAGGNVAMQGPSSTLAGALISSSKVNAGTAFHAGDVTINAGGTVTQDAGAIISAAANDCAAGAISITGAGQTAINGLVLAGPSRTISVSTVYSGIIMSGGGGHVVGGPITIKSLTHSEPGVVIGPFAVVAGQGGDVGTSGGSTVAIEGCNVQVNGLVASIARRGTGPRVVVRSGTTITVDGSTLGSAGAHNGCLRADATREDADTYHVDLYATKDITVVGAPAASGLFAVTSNPGSTDKRASGTINVTSLTAGLTSTANAFQASGTRNGDQGGSVNINTKGSINLNGTTIDASGATSDSNRAGGHIAVRSYSGAITWQSGVGDVRPVGTTAGVPVAQQGTISLTYCTTLSTSGTSFPTNGSAVGVFPTTTQTCSPAAPSLPAGESLPVCNTPPVANNGSASTLEDNSVTVTMTASDADGDSLTFSIVTGPAHGSLGAIFNATPTSAQVTYSPNANYNGSDSFTFKADDGKGGTSIGTVTITITPVNDPPTFNLGANPVTSLEDAGPQTRAGYASSISGGPTADEASQTVTFTVTNDNNALFSVQPAIDASGNLTYTSAANVNGSANVTVVAHDNGGTANGGNDTSTTHNFNIVVTAVNDAPSFTKGADQTSLEDGGAQTVNGWATAISAGPADESSQTVTFTATNDNNSLFSAQPAVASNGTLTWTAAANANGTATVSVVAHDDGGTANGGVDSSAAQTFTITITAVNDAPSFTKGADQTVLEDSGAQTVAGWATAISAGPADESSQTVSFTTTNDNNALFSAQPTVDAAGNLTYTPAADANGTATVSVTAHDNGGTANGGVDTSAAQTFTITVTAVNDAPSFTKGADQTSLEDAGVQTVAGWATAISAGPANESSQTVSFTATNDNNALFSAQPAVDAAGNLTYTPAADANGTATVSVTAHDNGGTANGGVDTSAAQTFTITVTAVNDAPSFTKGADQTSLEDAGAQTVAGWATAISAGPANESSQTVSFTATNDNNALFSAQPAVASNGTLTWTAAANANGTATVSVVAHDNGGTANGGVDSSAPQTFTITVTAVNDAPSFTKGADVTVLEDSGSYTAANWATAISAGPADESSQTVTFTTTNDNNSLFAVQPSVASNGTLTFTAAADAFGTATVSVTAHDDGGTANGGVDSSAAQTFTITITGVNDAPSFTKGPDVSVLSNAGPQSYPNWATSISAGPNEGAQTVSFLVSNDNNAVFTSQPAVSSTGTLTFTTASAAPTTTVHVTVAAHDNGGTANGGVDTSATQSFDINVTHANQAPVANNDSYDAVGNTELAVGTTKSQDAALVVASGSVLANDTDPDGDTLTAAAGSASAGASVTMNADGSFRYLPPAGFTGDDTFTYVLNDGQGHTVNGTVTIHVTKRVLYVKNNGGGSTGRVDSPYTTLALAQAASQNNDTVYVFTGDGTTTGQDAGFTINHNGERLIGEGVALKAAGTYNGSANPQLRAAGARPRVSNASGDAVSIVGVGTISNTEVSGVNVLSAGGHGVSATSATSVTMDNDIITASTHSGVRGTTVNGFSFTNGSITASGSTSGDANIAIDNLSGSATISNSSVGGAYGDNIRVANSVAGVLNRLTIDNVNFNGNSTTTGNTALLVSASSGVMNVTVTNSHFNSTRSQHAQMNLSGSPSADFVFTGNTMANSQGALSGGGGVLLTTGGGGNPSVTYDISNNTIRDAVGNAINVTKGSGTGNISGTILGNTIGLQSVVNSGSSQGSGIFVVHIGGGASATVVRNNVIQQYNNTGVTVQIGDAASGGNGSISAVVESNTMRSPGSLALYGFLLNAGTNAGDTHQVCLKLGGTGAAANSLTGGGVTANGGFDVRLRQRQATTVRLAGYAGANNDNAAVQSYVQSQNGGTPTVTAANTVPTGGGFVGGTCP